MNNQQDNQPSNKEGLDELLSAWHEDVDRRAKAARFQVLAEAQPPRAGNRQNTREHQRSPLMQLAHYTLRYLPYAALIALTALLVVFALPEVTKRSYAQDTIAQLPEGGRLDAFDQAGNEIGPCALNHTDINASVSGHLVRVDVKQSYGNPYDSAIEAVYTFPLSHRSAVDRMTMRIESNGEVRIVEGEVLERERARQIYESARDSGYVASLLEQERPNIFTQSVANIEPGARITISISYVEVLKEENGEYELVFPTVVGPRYIPGYPKVGLELPGGCIARRGIVLRGPAAISIEEAQDDQTISIDQLEGATPIAARTFNNDEEVPEAIVHFKVTYADGSVEPAVLLADNTGVIGTRWFRCPPPPQIDPGAAFAPDTDQVPDASRITPMPVHPSIRAGHDISISLDINTGGIPITWTNAPLHEVTEIAPKAGKGSQSQRSWALTKKDEIPNRDFVFKWKLAEDRIAESVLVHADPDGHGGHLALILRPPSRVEDADVPARELIFVLDTSGSMRGFPIEKAKGVMTRAIDGMREQDTFNLITFAGDTHILWNAPRPATQANRDLANKFLQSREGGGGTEMMTAINAALTQGELQSNALTAAALADLPADGRVVTVLVSQADLSQSSLRVNDNLAIDITSNIALPTSGSGEKQIQLNGAWTTRDGRRVFAIQTAHFADTKNPGAPMRVVVFMTDGYVGNDQAIIASINANADTTRVFSFGIGNSVNRYLLDGMAKAGRGAVEYVLLDDSADKAVERLANRIQNPVLIDIALETSDSIKLLDILPAGGRLPDLYDEKPLVIFARYENPATGTLTIRGRTGAGAFSRTIDLVLPANAPENDVVATLWARAQVDAVLDPHLAAVQSQTLAAEIREQVVALGEDYSIMTPYTSFVAVEKTRVVSDGKPMLVSIPIELPSGTDFTGFFGDPTADVVDATLEQFACGGVLDAPKETLTGHPSELEAKEGERFSYDGASVEIAYDERMVPPPIGGLTANGRLASQGRRQKQGAVGQALFYADPRMPQAPQALGSSTWRTRSGGLGGGGGAGGHAQAPSSEAFGASDEHELETEALVTAAEAEEGGDASTLETVDESVQEVPPAPPVYLSKEDFAQLARVLDRVLFRLAVASVLPEELAGQLQLTEERKVLDKKGFVLVSIKLKSLSATQRKALEAAGLQVVAQNANTSILVGRATPTSLVKIGLLENVLRVIPTQIKPAS